MRTRRLSLGWLAGRAHAESALLGWWAAQVGSLQGAHTLRVLQDAHDTH